MALIKCAGRAIEAPQVRRMFSSSARDPRYHMLEHLSTKFRMPPAEREPRAALILNRFTRTLSIMFSTPAVASIVGIAPDELQHKSFYDCIAPSCLPDAIRCLEGAKANDSIAYLRFWFRNPRRDEDNGLQDGEALHTTVSDETSSTSDESEGGAPIDDPMEVDMSSVSGTHRFRSPNHRSPTRQRPPPYVELEAVVSCTSDGLVVILRKARPALPSFQPPEASVQHHSGLFAAPWATQPVYPQYPSYGHENFQSPMAANHMPPQAHATPAGGPLMDSLMQSIRDVAVFAWGVVGINKNLTEFSHGVPSGEAQPHGFPSSSSSSSGNQQNYNGNGYWSSESCDDTVFTADHGHSIRSNATSQFPSNNGSQSVSPYVSDDSIAKYGVAKAPHAQPSSAWSYASSSTLAPYGINENHASSTSWGNANRGHHTPDHGELPGSMNWQTPSDGLGSTQPSSHDQVASQPPTSAEDQPSYPAK